jgi:hypothetical protein
MVRRVQDLKVYKRLLEISDTTERNVELAEFFRYVSYFVALEDNED